MGSRVTLIPQFYNRWLFGSHYRYNHNLVGGYLPERYVPWQMPFVGINNTYAPSTKTNIARADLCINLFGQHYLTLVGNYMAEWDFNDPDNYLNGSFGAGAIYSVNTVVGPIHLCAHWSTLSRSFGAHFSLGYYF